MFIDDLHRQRSHLGNESFSRILSSDELKWSLSSLEILAIRSRKVSPMISAESQLVSKFQG